MNVQDAIGLNTAITKVLAMNLDMRFEHQFALQLNSKTLAPVVATFDELRMKIVEKYANKGENGQLAFLPNKDGEDPMVSLSDPSGYAEAIDAFSNFELNLELQKIPLEAFPEYFDHSLLFGLEPMILED
jgi:nitrogen fixation protein